MEWIGIVAAIIGVFTGIDYIYQRIQGIVKKRKKIVEGVKQEEYPEIIKDQELALVENDHYRLPTLDDLNQGDWTWVYRSYNKLPFVATGNFFGDGHISQAFILIGKNDETFKVVIYSPTKRTEYVLLEGGDPFNVMIASVEPGEYSSHWERYNLKLKMHGIEISYLEKSSCIYYWNKKTAKFQQYWTAD